MVRFWGAWINTISGSERFLTGLHQGNGVTYMLKALSATLFAVVRSA